MLAPRPPLPAAAEGPAGTRLPGPVGAVLGLPAGTAAALVSWTLGGNAGIGLLLAALAAALLAAVTTPLGALGAAAQCWACYDGFVLHGLGTLEAGGPDRSAFCAVVGAAVVAHVVATLVAREPASQGCGRPGPTAPLIVVRALRAGPVAE